MVEQVVRIDSTRPLMNGSPRYRALKFHVSRVPTRRIFKYSHGMTRNDRMRRTCQWRTHSQRQALRYQRCGSSATVHSKNGKRPFRLRQPILTRLRLLTPIRLVRVDSTHSSMAPVTAPTGSFTISHLSQRDPNNWYAQWPKQLIA